MDGSADVAWALTAWPTPPARRSWRCRRPARRSRCGLGCGGGGLGGFSGGSGRRRLGGERSGGCDRRRGDRKRRGRLVGCWCRGSCRRRRCGSRDGNGNGVGRHHGRFILRRLGLIGDRGSVAGRCLRRLVGLRAIGLRRVGLRFGAAGRRGLGVGIGLGIGIGLGVDLPSSRALSLRALAAALRSFESLRAALSALSDAAALSRERLSDAACASSERRGAGALSWARLSLLLAAVLLSTSAAKLSFPADGSESGRADLAAAF